MAPQALGLLQGTVDVLILKTVSRKPLHGYGISEFIRGETGGDLAVEDAALYQALHRLERKGLVESEWGDFRLESARPHLLDHAEGAQAASQRSHRASPLHGRALPRARAGVASHASSLPAAFRRRSTIASDVDEELDVSLRGRRGAAARRGLVACRCGRGGTTALRRHRLHARVLSPPGCAARAREESNDLDAGGRAGHALRAARAARRTQLHAHRARHPRLRHRRQYRDLQRRARRAARSAPVSRCVAARARLGRQSRGGHRAGMVLGARPQRHSRVEPPRIVDRRIRVRGWADRCRFHGHRHSGASLRCARGSGLFRNAPAATRARARARRRRA